MKISCFKICLFFISFLIINSNSFAFFPEKHLLPEQEARARELFLQVKCPICVGQVIASSDADISIELRKLIRQQIAQGKNDQEIKDYLIENYGNDILLSNSIDKRSFALWFLPLVFFVVGIFVIILINYKK